MLFLYTWSNQRPLKPLLELLPRKCRKIPSVAKHFTCRNRNMNFKHTKCIFTTYYLN